ncbi:lysophospholipid acyltransferase family protein [Dietzia sp.]|uniref:lysophospholipid acyltransferase family protein n=1 Tax=Dietzia sp. TaxID=1871616 RepID=UPI002FDAD737
MFYWLLKWVLLGPWLHLVGRPSFEGAENFPREGAALVAVNHLSASDWLFLPLRTPRRMTFLAKQEYFTKPGLYGAFQRFFFSATGQVPIDRSSADAATDAMETGIKVLESGEVLGMFPEGTRSPDGDLYKGKTGVARVAMRAGVPIIPVGLKGTDVFLSQDSLRPHPTKIRIKVGEPIPIEEWVDKVGDRAAERELTNLVMERIQELSGQTYHPDEYGAEVKKRLEAEGR